MKNPSLSSRWFPSGFAVRLLIVLSVSAALSSRLPAAESVPAAKAPPAAAERTPAPALPTGSVQGRWTAEFDTQVGVQKYTYEFKVQDGKLTGTANGDQFGGTVQIAGKVEGNMITFTEKEDIGGMDIAITYTGEIKGDEIAFKREVGDLATEDLVAKRLKPETTAAGAAPKKN